MKEKVFIFPCLFFQVMQLAIQYLKKNHRIRFCNFQNQIPFYKLFYCNSIIEFTGQYLDSISNARRKTKNQKKKPTTKTNKQNRALPSPVSVNLVLNSNLFGGKQLNLRYMFKIDADYLPAGIYWRQGIFWLELSNN